MPPRNGRGAGPSVRILHRVIACEAGRLAVDFRHDTIAPVSGKNPGPTMLNVSTRSDYSRVVHLFFRHLHRVGAANKTPRGRFRFRLGDGVLCKDLLDPLERLFCRGLGRHATLDDVHPALHPNMLVLELGIGRVERPELRHRRVQQALGGVSRSAHRSTSSEQH